DLVCLPANVIGDAGLGQQISFIRGIDKHLATVGFAGLHRDRYDAGPLLLGALHELQALAEDNGDLIFTDQIVVDSLGDVRFEGPGRILFRIMARTAEVRAFFVFPARIVLVVATDALVKLAPDATDGPLVADVGRAQPAGGHAP